MISSRGEMQMNKPSATEPNDTPQNLIRRVLSDSNFSRVRFLVAASIVMSLLPIFYNNLVLSCIMAIVQNVVLVYMANREYLKILDITVQVSRMRQGAMFGSFMGSISATISIVLSNIQFYFLGFREIAYSAGGDSIPPLSIEILWAELGSQLIIWCFLVLLSAGVGLVSAAISNPKNHC